jgi:hypothetical protein
MYAVWFRRLRRRNRTVLAIFDYEGLSFVVSIEPIALNQFLISLKGQNNMESPFVFGCHCKVHKVNVEAVV